MWTDNLVFYKSKSYLIFVQVLAFTKRLLVYQQNSITRYILTVWTRPSMGLSDTWSDDYGQTS